MTMFSDHARLMIQTLGEQVTFTPAAGSSVSVWVNIENETLMQSSGDASVVGIGTTIEYVKEDVGRRVLKGETFTTGEGIVYTAQYIVSDDETTVQVAVRQ